MEAYSVKDVGDKLSVSKRTIERLISGGKLAAIKVGRQWRVSKYDLEKYIKKQTTKTNA